MANYSGRSLFRQLFLLFCCYVFNLEASKNDEFFEELYIKPLQSGHVSFYFQFTTKWNISLQDADNCEPHSLDVDHVTNKSRRLICSFLFPRRNYPKQHTADGRLYALFFLLRVNILRHFFPAQNSNTITVILVVLVDHVGSVSCSNCTITYLNALFC